MNPSQVNKLYFSIMNNRYSNFKTHKIPEAMFYTLNLTLAITL
uniref:Uncharacterized protein n=1 Tax=Rhizophora mucronata TaxID=61149 RepID=A0A2P2IWY8_RHIMU